MRRNACWTIAVAALMIMATIGAEAQDAAKNAAEKQEGPILEFRIVAEKKKDAEAAGKALEGEGLKTPPKGYRWAKVAAGVDAGEAIVREVPAEGDKPAHKVILLRLDRQNVTEADVERFRQAQDEQGAPAIEFRFNPSGSRRFVMLTRANQPEENGAILHRLAIVVDGEVVAAPAIRAEVRNAGIISGLKAEEIVPLIERLKKAAPDAKARDEAIKGFDDARFGLSIRWGLAGDSANLEKRAKQFKGEAFDAEAWVKLAKASGAKFLIVSARGRDGFSLFDTRQTTFDAVEGSPFAKDPLKLVSEACRKGALPLYVSYSTDDPRHPESKKVPEREFREQIRELCIGYGDLAGIIFEGTNNGLGSAVKIVRETQPSALIGGEDGDVRLSTVDPVHLDPKTADSPTLIRSPIEGPGLKTTSELVQSLVEAAGRGVDLAIEITPAPDGSIPKPVADRLEEVGRWIGQYGVSVIGTRPGPIAPTSWGVSTQKGDVIYVHILRPEPKLNLPPFASPEVKGGALFGDRKVDGFELGGVSKTNSDLYLVLPESARIPIDTIVVLNPPPPAKKAEEPKKKAKGSEILIEKSE